MRVLVTGAAGFIGSHVCLKLLDEGHEVLGVDNLNDYYDVSLKEARLARLAQAVGFSFQRLDIADFPTLCDAFARFSPHRVVHLAAQAGVRYSITHPATYVQSNLVGFGNILECCRAQAVEHLVYASSSSVYGATRSLPLAVESSTDQPLSLYAATKKSNELMAHSYAHLFDLPVTGLRFFTVYGPWGRPDMSYYRFIRAMLAGQPIDVYNHGQMKRDFTYIDDIVEGVVRVLRRLPDGDANGTPCALYNIGSHRPIELLRFIEVIEGCLGVKAVKNMLPLQAGDMLETYADVTALQRDVGFEPSTTVEEGVPRLVAWYLDYHRVGRMAGASLGASASACGPACASGHEGGSHGADQGGMGSVSASSR